MLASKTRYFRIGALALAISGTIAATPALADGELSASAAVSNMYLWRGLDLGDGSAAVSGDLTYSLGGAYGGVWISSGDSTLGSEYDLYFGYGAEMGDFSFDISLWNYNYSDGSPNVTGSEENAIAALNLLQQIPVFPAALAGVTTTADVTDDTTGELSEIITTVAYKGISLSYYDNIAGATGYEYWTLSGGYEKFSATLGFHDFDLPSASIGNENMTHLNLNYAFNDNLTFTVSKIIDQDCDNGDTNCVGAFDEDVNVALSYALPIDV